MQLQTLQPLLIQYAFDLIIFLTTYSLLLAIHTEHIVRFQTAFAYFCQQAYLCFVTNHLPYLPAYRYLIYIVHDDKGNIFPLGHK